MRHLDELVVPQVEFDQVGAFRMLAYNGIPMNDLSLQFARFKIDRLDAITPQYQFD